MKEKKNIWDYWEIEWKNAKAFFDSKGNLKTRSKLKTKWNKEFEKMMKEIYNKGFMAGVWE